MNDQDHPEHSDDPEHLSALFRDHYDAVLAYALARAPVELAKDAAAETFTVAWRRRAELPAEPLPWLIGVTRRTLADARRSSSRLSSLRSKLAAQPMALGLVRDPADQAVERDEVMRALRKLSPSDQEVLTLVAWDGLSNAEVAEVVGWSQQVAALRLHRARRRLQAALEMPGPDSVRNANRATKSTQEPSNAPIHDHFLRKEII
ncbi:MAG: RNA polymerase sigma factor [Acidimicrobiales bacterium]